MTRDSQHKQIRIWPEKEEELHVIPDKLYFKIGEVCDITGLKQHAIRYWESEFSFIKPLRSASKQRLYRRVDVETILKLKKLLHEEGFTIAGARKHFSKEKEQTQRIVEFDEKTITSWDEKKFIQDIKQELLLIKEILEK